MGPSRCTRLQVNTGNREMTVLRSRRLGRYNQTHRLGGQCRLGHVPPLGGAGWLGARGAMRVADVDDWPGSGMSRTAWLVRPGGRVAEAKHTPGQGLAARRPCGRHAAVSLTICSLHPTESHPVGGLRGGFPITSHVPTTSHWPSCHPPGGEQHHHHRSGLNEHS